MGKQCMSNITIVRLQTLIDNPSALEGKQAKCAFNTRYSLIFCDMMELRLWCAMVELRGYR